MYREEAKLFGNVYSSEKKKKCVLLIREFSLFEFDKNQTDKHTEIVKETINQLV